MEMHFQSLSKPHFTRPLFLPNPNPLQLHLTTTATNFRFQTSHYPTIPKQQSSFLLSSSRGFCDATRQDLRARNCLRNRTNMTSSMKGWVRLFRSFAPGGDWWELRGSVESGSREGKTVTVPSALWRIWLLVSGDRWIIFIAFASLSIAALSEISIPSLLASSVFAAKNGERVVFHRNCQTLILLCMISGVCSGLRGGCFGIANSILVKRLRETLYPVLLYQDISFFDAAPVGNLTSRLGADCQRLSSVIGNNIHLIIRNTLQGTGALVNLMSLSWPLALSSTAVCFFLASISVIYGRYQKEAARLSQELEASANDAALEAFDLVKTVRVFGTGNEEFGRYKYWLDKLAFVSLRGSIAYGLWNLSFNTLYRSTQQAGGLISHSLLVLRDGRTIVGVIFGGVSVSRGDISPEQLLRYILYCEWLIYATWRLVDNTASLYESIGASETVFQMLDLLPCNQFLAEGVKLQKLKGHIEFSNVSFHYPVRLQVPALEHVSITIQANEAVAIVGRSGSGKSTLIKLLLRLYEPTDGQILIDGVPVKNLDARWLRDQMGYVGQEPDLMRSNVKSNISYGCRRPINCDDIESAAKLALAHDFISSLPDGYDTLVDGNLLSGGQRQRIAIARAILRKPKILILDESTSALDAEIERYITDVLQALKADPSARLTIIIIAHRLSTVRVADRILVMDGGKIAETGNHKELIEKKGLYKQLVEMQTQALNIN